LFGCLEYDLPPRFPFFDATISPLKPNSPRRELNEGFQNILQIFTFELNLVQIFHDVQHLTELFIKRSATHVFTDRRELDHLAQSLRHRLLSYPSARITTTPEDNIRESLRLGTLICIKIILPGYPSRDRVYQTLVQKLKLCIESINLSGFASNGIVGELVLWLLFVGGIVDLGDAHMAWFMLRISKVAEAMQVREWSEVKAILRKFSFVEELHGRPCLALWNRIIMGTAFIV
jgi:hypothetical protein